MRKAGSVKAFSAFFMCPVSHTFPAYNGNEMPSWYTIIFFVYGRVVYKPRCLPLFFSVRTFAAVCARAWDDLPAMSRHTMSKAQREKPAFFDRGAKSFLWSAFLSGNSFFCARFCTVARAWKEPLPSVVFHPVPGRKSGFPGLCQPVAHACKPMPNPAIFRFKICGLPGVAATTHGFSAGRTWRNFSPPCGAN